LGDNGALTKSVDAWMADLRFYSGAGGSNFLEQVRLLAASPPTGLSAAGGSNKVDLAWSALGSVSSYNVKRSTTSGGPYTTISAPGTLTGTSYSDATAVNGTTYYYVFSGMTPYGETVNSSEVSATPLLPCTPPPAPIAGCNSPMYAGMTLILTASTVPGAVYSWVGPNAFTSTYQNPIIENAAQVASGEYSVTASVGGCVSPAGKTTVLVNPPVSVSVQPSSEGLVFNWAYGTLQSAANVTGPWNDVAGAIAPYTNTSADLREFFRIRLQ